MAANKRKVQYEVRDRQEWRRPEQAIPLWSGWLAFVLDGQRAWCGPADWRIVTVNKEQPDGR